MYGLHPALPARLMAAWREAAGADFDSERAAAEAAFLAAHAAFGRWLLQQIRGGAAEMAMALIARQRRTLGRQADRALHQDRFAEAQAILQPLNDFWNARGLYAEARGWAGRCRKALEGPDGTPPGFATPAGALWLFVVTSEANRALRAGDLDAGEAEYDAIRIALEAAPGEAARSRLAVAYHQLGMVAQDRGELDAAERWYGRALEIAQALDNRPYMASIYHQLGNVAYLRGELAAAERWYGKSLEIKDALGDRPGMSGSYHQLGMVAQDRGDRVAAERWYGKSLEIKEALGDRPGMATSYHQLGNVSYLRGELAAAERWYGKSLEIKEALGDRPGMAPTYGQLGLLAEQRGNAAQALDWMVRCVALFAEFPHPATGPGPHNLARLTAALGLDALEAAWLRVTGQPLPAAIRTHVTKPAP